MKDLLLFGNNFHKRKIREGQGGARQGKAPRRSDRNLSDRGFRKRL
jgi:hypothetical protein